MKKCKKCTEQKKESEFYQNGMGGLRPKCKKCEREETNKKFKPKSCAYCGKLYMPSQSTQKYCSHKCKCKVDMERRSNKPNFKICEYCNKEYVPYTSLSKFCSAECRINNIKSKRDSNWNLDQINKRIGKNNPAYRNGDYCRSKKKTNIGQRLFEKNRDKLKHDIIERHGYLYCEVCQITNTLRFETHHLIYRSEKPLHKNLHDTINLVLLCVTCHNEFHKHKGLRNNIVAARQLNKLFGDDVLNK